MGRKGSGRGWGEARLTQKILKIWKSTIPGGCLCTHLANLFLNLEQLQIFLYPLYMMKAFFRVQQRAGVVGYSNSEHVTNFPPLPLPLPPLHVFCHPVFYILITGNLFKGCTWVALVEATFSNVILLMLGGLKINMICDLLVIFFFETKKQSTPLSAVLIKPNTL